MKKSLLFAVALCPALLTLAQKPTNITNIDPEKDVAVKADDFRTGLEVSQGAPYQAVHPVGVTEAAINIIGAIGYDLQSNSGVRQHTVDYGVAGMGSVWTVGLQAAAYPDRGTGYNYHDGTSWTLGTPSTRLEATTRTGWATLLQSATGGEMVVAHSGTGGLTVLNRPVTGTGTWTESTIPNPSGKSILWPRAAVGGPTNQTVHVIAISTDTAQGFINPFYYYRSQDFGSTWEIVDSILPGFDTSENKSISADDYQIIADGNDIAFVVGSSWSDIMLFKSADNGASWTKTVISDFPINGFEPDQPCGSDIDGDCVADTVETTDGAVSIIRDLNGDYHCAWGEMRVLDADPNDGGTSFFPGTNGIAYWNENMTAPITLTGALDLNGNNTLDLAAEITSSYGTGLASHTSMAVDELTGDIFLSYSAVVENLAFFDQASGMADSANYRHVYIMKSSDNGNTWTDPWDATSEDDFAECVFADLADRVIGNELHFTYQSDILPGVSVGNNANHTPNNGDWVHKNVSTGLTTEEPSSTVKFRSLAPNPMSTVANLTFSLASPDELSYTIYNVVGQPLTTVQLGKMNNGIHQIEVDLSTLPNGIYVLNMETATGTVSQKIIKQ